MHIHSKIQKWGNSSAIRLPTKALAAAGINPDSDVDIQASKGRLVIQLREKTQEQLFDKLFREIPDAADLLGMVQESITTAISLTDETTRIVEASREEMKRNK